MSSSARATLKFWQKAAPAAKSAPETADGINRPPASVVLAATDSVA
jgi:hypothetical protein